MAGHATDPSPSVSGTHFLYANADHFQETIDISNDREHSLCFGVTFVSIVAPPPVVTGKPKASVKEAAKSGNTLMAAATAMQVPSLPYIVWVFNDCVVHSFFVVVRCIQLARAGAIRDQTAAAAAATTGAGKSPEEQAAGALVAAKQELMVHALLWQYGPNLPASIRDAWALAAAFDLATVNAPPQGIIHYSVVMLANNASDVVCERLY